MNELKSQSVIYIQYSQHKLRNVSRKSKLLRRERAFMGQQPKHLKQSFSRGITNLLTINQVIKFSL